ncbi:AraC-like DNA-binding protein [Saccharopolyspora lacisalsi]|uniref:AraC-like DNA-binding protein n=1 Tax=Halosaccharopolyspora lacisalsi TaxID=1000566 RepID=A0A839DQF8_9PSEU|nr:helix-turn-helix domain-containing protein [Halosaccharopolyspora lacisalsi]MBA8823744.1 AraC-like DNA-binding protein [Halosaccharopolyspora lacisalsi]
MAGSDRGDEFVSTARLLPEAVVSAVGYRTVDSAPVIHRGLPSPSLTVVFSLDDPIVAGLSPEHANGPDAFRNRVVLGGLHTRPAYVVQPTVQTGVQLAVRPLAARALLGVPAGELRDLTTEGVDVLGASAARLREQLAELTTWDERFAALARYLRDRVAAQPRAQPRAEVAAAWSWIARHRGTGSMSELARHVLLSPRQLTTVFNSELGLTPKAASRLMRFEHARQHVTRASRRGLPPDIAATAHACGYSDHAHLVHDFQQYVGTSPTRWLAEERRNIQAGAHRDGEDWGT